MNFTFEDFYKTKDKNLKNLFIIIPSMNQFDLYIFHHIDINRTNHLI
jgi:hypothetical protein